MVPSRKGGTSGGYEARDVSAGSESWLPQLGAVGLKAGLGSQHNYRQPHLLLPQDRFHCDIERLVLYCQLINGLIVGGMVVHAPAGRRQHQITRLPFMDLALDCAAAASGEIIIDRR